MPAGGETTLFKQFFFNWLDKDETTGPSKAYTIGRIAQVEQIPFDSSKLHSNNIMAAQHGMVDDGSGKVKVWLTSLTTLMLYIHFFKYQRVDVTVVGACRFGVWKEVIRFL